MNKKNKLILLIAALLAAAFVVAACARGEEEAPAPAAATPAPAVATPAPGAPTPTPVEPIPDPIIGLRDEFGLRPDVSTGDDTIYLSLQEWMIAGGYLEWKFEYFQIRHPYVNIELRFEPNNAPHLVSEFMAGTFPDVVFDAQPPMAALLIHNILHPLNEFLDPETDPCLRYLPDIALEWRTFNGLVYGLPSRVHLNHLVAINLDMLDEFNLDMPPVNWTFDDFTRLALAASTATTAGVQNIPPAQFLGLTMSPNEHLWGFVREDRSFNLGGGWVNMQNQLAEWRAIPNFIAFDLRNPEFPTGGEGAPISDYEIKFGALDLSDLAAAFNSGQVLMRFFPLYQRASFQENWAGDFRVAMHSAPQDPRFGKRPIAHAISSLMSAHTAHPEAAFELLRWSSISEIGLLAGVGGSVGRERGFFYIPQTTNPRVIAALDRYWNVGPGIMYTIENFHNAGMIALWHSIPHYGEVVDDVLSPANVRVFEGDDPNAVAAEVSAAATSIIRMHWAAFYEILEEVQAEFEAGRN